MVKNSNENHPGETGTKSTLIRSELLPESPGKVIESLSLQVFRIIISSNGNRIKAEEMLPSLWGFLFNRMFLHPVLYYSAKD